MNQPQFSIELDPSSKIFDFAVTTGKKEKTDLAFIKGQLTYDVSKIFGFLDPLVAVTHSTYQHSRLLLRYPPIQTHWGCHI